MSKKTKLCLVIVVIAFLGVSAAYSNTSKEGNAKIVRSIVTSDTILSGMMTSLLPQNRYSVEAILPPGQCPGHYDVKLSDIEKMKKADLNVSFRGMSFLKKAIPGGGAQLLVDAGGRNWMAPDSYVYGLGFLPDEIHKQETLSLLFVTHDFNMLPAAMRRAVLLSGLVLCLGSRRALSF